TAIPQSSAVETQNSNSALTAGGSTDPTPAPSVGQHVNSVTTATAKKNEPVKKADKAATKAGKDDDEEKDTSQSEATETFIPVPNNIPVTPNMPDFDASAPLNNRRLRRLGGVTVRTLPDGTVVVTKPDGTREVTFPNGQRRVLRP